MASPFFSAMLAHQIDFGVPVNDRILLSKMFVICAFCLASLVIDAWQTGARWRMGGCRFDGAWLLNVVYVTTARSAVVVMLGRQRLPRPSGRISLKRNWRWMNGSTV